MRLPRASENETLWPLLVIVTLCVSSESVLLSAICRDSVLGMTILKFTLAVAATAVAGAAVRTWDSDAAVCGSNSSNEAVPIKPLNAHVQFTIGFLFRPTSKVSTTGSATLMIIPETVWITYG